MRRLGTAVLAITLTLGPIMAIADEEHHENNHDDLHRVTVRLTEYRFDPPLVSLNADTLTELTIVNKGTVMHEFLSLAFHETAMDVVVNGVITAAMGVVEFEIPAGATVMLRFTPEHTGEFDLMCRAKDPDDHFKKGMFGKIVVR